ncbi:hypothetical protein VE03_10688 [Pseudogymnoascus sp. 23342-1-I1]|nr:hypothetical protein VE03_10688 [Pseudogymnoascus sp. 23342-1-I1]
MPRITDDYGDLVNFSKTTVIQAQKAYEEAKGILNNVLTELETCTERFNKLIFEIERCGNGLEEYRRQFDSDSAQPGNMEIKMAILKRLEQQRSMVSTCLRTSCREFEKLRSKITMEDSCEDSDSFSESTMEDSVTEDISPNGITR